MTDLLRNLAVIAVLKARVAQAEAALRDRIASSLTPGTTIPALLDGAEIATVTYARAAKGRVTAAVTDTHALLRWAREYAPHLVTEHVNTPCQTVLLEAAKEGDWEHVDKATGEVVRIPVDGVTVTPARSGTPVLRVKVNPAADGAVQAAVASGALSYGDVLKALEATP